MRNCTFDNVLNEMFVERWLSTGTQESYIKVVRIFRKYLGADVLPSDVMRADVLAWRMAIVRSEINPSGIAETSWNNYVRHMRSVYRFGISNDLIFLKESPFEGVFLREKRKGPKTLRDTDIFLAREALEACRRHEVVTGKPASLHPAWFWRVVVEMFYHTGIRLSQLLRMKPDDVNLRKRCFLASAEGAKNSSEIVLPITKNLYPHLVVLMTSAHATGFEKHDQLFNVNRFSVRHKRKTMNVCQVEKFFQKLSPHCGGRISPHRFRHSLATDLMRSQGRDLYLTQQVCGHTHIRSTLGYVEPDLDTLRWYLEQRGSAGGLGKRELEGGGEASQLGQP